MADNGAQVITKEELLDLANKARQIGDALRDVMHEIAAIVLLGPDSFYLVEERARQLMALIGQYQEFENRWDALRAGKRTDSKFFV